MCIEKVAYAIRYGQLKDARCYGKIQTRLTLRRKHQIKPGESPTNVTLELALQLEKHEK